MPNSTFKNVIDQILGNTPAYPNSQPVPAEFEGYGTDEMVGLLCTFNRVTLKMAYVGACIAECVYTDIGILLNPFFTYQVSFVSAGDDALGFNNIRYLYSDTDACNEVFVINELYTDLGGGDYAYALHIACKGYKSQLFWFQKSVSGFTWQFLRSKLIDNVFNAAEIQPIDPAVFDLITAQSDFAPAATIPTVLSVLSANPTYDQPVTSAEICEYKGNDAKICSCENDCIQALRYYGALAYKVFELQVQYFDLLADVPCVPLLGNYPDNYYCDINSTIEYWQNILDTATVPVNLPQPEDVTNSLCRCHNDYTFHVILKYVYEPIYDAFIQVVQIKALPINRSLRPYILNISGYYLVAPYAPIQKIAIYEGAFHGLSNDYGDPFNNTFNGNIASYGFLIIPAITAGIDTNPVIDYSLDNVTIERSNYENITFPTDPFPRRNLKLIYTGIPDVATYDTGDVLYADNLQLDFTECCQDPTTTFVPYLQWEACDTNQSPCDCCAGTYELLVGDNVSQFVPVDLLTPANFQLFLAGEMRVVLVTETAPCTFERQLLQPIATLYPVAEKHGFFTTRLSSDVQRGDYKFAVVHKDALDTVLLVSEGFYYISEPSDNRGGCLQYKYLREVRFKCNNNALGFLYGDLVTELGSTLTADKLWQQLRFPIELLNVQTKTDRVVQKTSFNREVLLSSTITELWDVTSKWLGYNKLLLLEKIFAHSTVQIRNNITNAWETYTLDSRQDMRYPDKYCQSQIALRIKKNDCVQNNFAC